MWCLVGSAWFSAELFPERYWEGPKSHEVVEQDNLPNTTLSLSVSPLE